MSRDVYTICSIIHSLGSQTTASCAFRLPGGPGVDPANSTPLADSVVKSPDTGVEWRDEIIGGAGEYRILAFHAILLDGVSPIQLILCPF